MHSHQATAINDIARCLTGDGLCSVRAFREVHELLFDVSRRHGTEGCRSFHRNDQNETNDLVRGLVRKQRPHRGQGSGARQCGSPLSSLLACLAGAQRASRSAANTAGMIVAELAAPFSRLTCACSFPRQCGINYHGPMMPPGSDMAPQPRSVLLLANSTAVAEVFSRITAKFDLLYSKSVHSTSARSHTPHRAALFSLAPPLLCPVLRCVDARLFIGTWQMTRRRATSARREKIWLRWSVTTKKCRRTRQRRNQRRSIESPAKAAERQL